MQKWEYCVVGQIENDGKWKGHDPELIYLTETGKKATYINKSGPIDEAGMLAATVAKLGMEGWEMVGAVTTSVSQYHTLYFKRPIDE